MLPLSQLRVFAGEVGKLAGLTTHPAVAAGATKRLLGSTPSAPTSGLAQTAKITSPAALVAPPNTFA